MEENNFQKKIEEIKSRIDAKTTLHISRIPEKSKTRFMELANEEFADDYGMLLMECLNSYIELRQLKKILYSGEFKLGRRDV